MKNLVSDSMRDVAVRLVASLPARPSRLDTIAGLLIIVVSQASVAADEVGPAAAPDWVQQRVAAANGSVVLVTVEGRDGGQAGLGTGFVVAADGLIATNLHVIGEARPIKVRFRDGRQYPVTEIYASDQHLDLALIRIAAEGLSPLPLVADEQEVEQGQPILALGNPMGLRHSVVSGVISGHREIDGRQMLQIAIPIEPGNSGGPVIDQAGQVLGIVTLKSALTANLGFAIQASELKTLLARPNPIAMSRWETIGALNPADWTPLFGARWRQRSGRIVAQDAGISFGGRTLCLWNREQPEGDFEVGVFVRMDRESGAAGLVFGADGGDRHYGFYVSSGRLRLTRFDGPTVYSWQILDELATPHYLPGDWNHLKVHLSDDRLTCFVNDQAVLSRQLSESPSGRVGLAKFRDTEAQFKRFQLGAHLEPSRLSAERLALVREELKTLSLEGARSAPLSPAFVADPIAGGTALQERAEELEAEAAHLRRLAEDLHVQTICQQLIAQLDPRQDPINLTHAALLVSCLDNRELEVAAYLTMFDRIAEEIRATLDPTAPAVDRLQALNQYLFAENGFHGSRTNYYQAANSYLDRVLDDREGLPITLSVLYLELGRRLEIPMEGVGLPGHFVVRYVPAEGAPELIDVFEGGVRLSREQAERRARMMTGEPLSDADFAPVGPREMVLRMLRNLQGIAQRQQEPEALLRYLEAMVALEPDEPSYRGMRAVVRQQTGRREAALSDLDWFLSTAPDGVDLEAIRTMRRRFSESPTP